MKENEKKLATKALEVLYDVNKSINLLESIGIRLDGNIDDNNIGSYLYEISTEATDIIELLFGDDKPENFTAIAEILEVLYIEDDNKENKVKECLALLMKKTHKDATNPFTIVDPEKFYGSKKDE